MSSFNSNRNQPSIPVVRQLRHVVADVRSGRINTNTRYGRKQIWKEDQSILYIKTLLDGEFHVDPISLSEQGTGSNRVENAVNGNNRLRSIIWFTENKWGVPAEDADRKTYTWYYSSIPQHELDKPHRRSKCKVLTDAVKRNFDDFPVLLNVRFALSESQEIQWYKTLNSNVRAHTAGHLLVANICDTSSAFAANFLSTFPAMKARVNEPPSETDAYSLGVCITDATGVENEPMNNDDKKECTLLGQAVVFNLLANGKPYDEDFKGPLNPEKLARATAEMKAVFTESSISESLKGEMNTPVYSKPFMKTLCLPGYLLGPIAWSIATEKPLAVEVWSRFLGMCVAGTIDDVYGREIAAFCYNDTNVKKYIIAWERVLAHVGMQNA